MRFFSAQYGIEDKNLNSNLSGFLSALNCAMSGEPAHAIGPVGRRSEQQAGSFGSSRETCAHAGRAFGLLPAATASRKSASAVMAGEFMPAR